MRVCAAIAFVQKYIAACGMSRHGVKEVHTQIQRPSSANMVCHQETVQFALTGGILYLRVVRMEEAPLHLNTGDIRRMLQSQQISAEGSKQFLGTFTFTSPTL